MTDYQIPTRTDRLLKAPLILGSAILTTITALWGIVSIFKDLKEFFGAPVAAYVIAGIIAACLLPALVLFFVTIWKWWFFLPIDLSNRFLHPEIHRKWAIGDRGSATIFQEKSLLFFNPPTREDLSDLIFSSEPLKLDELNQRSDDCVYTDHHEISKGVHRVYWKPKKGEVVVGRTYKHKTETHFPFDKVPAYKCMTIPFAATTVKFRLVGTSEIPISKVVAFRGSRFIRISHSAERIANKGLKVKRKRAPLPSLSDAHNFTWEIKNVAPGKAYFVVVYF